MSDMVEKSIELTKHECIVFEMSSIEFGSMRAAYRSSYLIKPEAYNCDAAVKLLTETIAPQELLKYS